jgi:hypothetical protein
MGGLPPSSLRRNNPVPQLTRVNSLHRTPLTALAAPGKVKRAGIDPRAAGLDRFDLNHSRADD